MDVDFWASRVHSAKHLTAVQAARLNAGDDDARAYFPCPFCYVDIEIPVLCSHLQEEHCFDLKNAVCPLCAANLGKDVIGHFTLQHAHSLKRRRKSQNLVPGQIGNSYESAPDPLLSPFLCSISVSDGNQQDKCSSDNASFASDMKSTVPSTPSEDQEQDYEERQQRAIFVQQLIGSTIF
ncbi:hypothetical protein AAG906_026786 [Vitis piasezkii]